ncbi:hypothetical protein DEO72_LG6g1250 [Vigna unguiculata]|uniref:Uncharacterized protein n=1 Tax=Vigna unguiculata TaxID=3917 RepID=A0A4D6M9P3_VIGUN|nr:hypothetical protein DEO72_LG6g1250 [Vigna unguiculata]
MNAAPPSATTSFDAVTDQLSSPSVGFRHLHLLIHFSLPLFLFLSKPPAPPSDQPPFMKPLKHLIHEKRSRSTMPRRRRTKPLLQRLESNEMQPTIVPEVEHL